MGKTVRLSEGFNILSEVADGLPSHIKPEILSQQPDIDVNINDIARITDDRGAISVHMRDGTTHQADRSVEAIFAPVALDSKLNLPMQAIKVDQYVLGKAVHIAKDLPVLTTSIYDMMAPKREAEALKHIPAKAAANSAHTVSTAGKKPPKLTA